MRLLLCPIVHTLPVAPARVLLVLAALAASALSLAAGDASRRALADDADASGEGPAAVNRIESDKQRLDDLQLLVGQWKGVGQLRRGSTEGSWLETSDWVWKFGDGRAALTFASPKGKYIVAGRVEPGDEDDTFLLRATLADGQTEVLYRGEQDLDGVLTLTAQSAPTGQPGRITFRTVAQGDRLLVLLERPLGDTGRFTRLAEIGYTRQGSNFGQGTVQRECVVTGGAGTIPVTFEGQTYYVCCTGCRDLFNDDPAGTLADYQARKEAEKKKRAEKAD